MTHLEMIEKHKVEKDRDATRRLVQGPASRIQGVYGILQIAEIRTGAKLQDVRRFL